MHMYLGGHEMETYYFRGGVGVLGLVSMTVCVFSNTRLLEGILTCG